MNYLKPQKGDKPNMSKAKQARQHLITAHEIAHSSSTYILQLKQKLTEELVKIGHDPRLTAVGKQEEVAAIKKKFGIEFLQGSHTRKQKYLAEVRKAYKLADEAVYATVKKPDATKLERFESELRSLKTELLFAPNQRTAYEKLTEFVRKIDDPYLAGRVRDEYAEISEKIMSAPGEGSVRREGDGGAVPLPIKHVLGELYGRLKSDYESDEVREARQILEAARAMEEDPKIYASPIVRDAVTQSLGTEYARYMDDTYAYFADKPDLKPADYVDEEEEAARKAAEASAWIRKPIDNPTLKV